MWPSSEADGEEEPDWVKTEREQFTQFRDKNKDNFMDRAEVAEWILPPDYDHTEAEAKHLIAESDEDGVSVTRWLAESLFNSLVPGRCRCNLKLVISYPYQG